VLEYAFSVKVSLDWEVENLNVKSLRNWKVERGKNCVKVY